MKTTGVVSGNTASACASASLEMEAERKTDDETADGLPELVVDTDTGARTKSNGVGSTDSVDSGLAGDHSSPEHEHGYAAGRSNRRRPRGALKIPPYPGFEWVPQSQDANGNGYYYNYDKLSPLGDTGMECELGSETSYGSHIVYVHVNVGETLSVRVGDEVQHIPGPATVRMVTSRNAAPPAPLPLHVPPGHIVQQILDEYGTLRHLVLSPQTPPTNVGAAGPFQVVNMSNGYVSPDVQFVDANGTTTYYDGTCTYAVSPDPSTGEILLDGSAPCGMIDPNDINGVSPPSYQQNQEFLEPSVTPNAREPTYRRPFKQYQASSPDMDDQTRINGHGGIENQYSAVPPRIGGRRKRNGAYSYRGPSVLSDANGRYQANDRFSGKPGRMNNERNRYLTKSDGPIRNYRSSYHNSYSQPPVVAPYRPQPEPVSGDTSTLSSSNPTSSHDDDEMVNITDMLSRIPPPQVRDISSCAAFVQWQPFDCSEASANGGSFPQIDASEFTYEVLLYEHSSVGEPKQNHRCQAELYPQFWLTDLKPANDYFVRLRALLEERGIHGEPSAAIAFKTKAAQPDKPDVPKVQQRSKTWLLVTWQRPRDNGSEISSYHLEIEGLMDKEKGFKEIYAGSAEEYTIQNLLPATSYQIRLAASNSVGKSEYSDVISAKTTDGAPPVPDPPTLVEATSSTMTLRWKRRECDDEFQLLVDDQEDCDLIITTRDVMYKVPNLAHSREYRFRLAASNDEGSSPVSRVATFRTLPPKPSSPSNLKVVGDVSDTVTITWDVNYESETVDEIRYVLEMLKPPSQAWTVIYEGIRQEFAVTRLEPGSSYQFRVFSQSQGGKSEPSEELELATPTSPPGPCDPPTLSQQPEPTVLHLQWTPPEISGGSEVTEYELSIGHPSKPMAQNEATTDRIIYRGWNTDYTVSTGLQPGCTYLFRVRGHNAVGPGPWSESFECHTSAPPPECPQRLRLVEVTSRNAYLMWEHPGFNNGSPVTEYRLHQAYRKQSSVPNSPAQTPTDEQARPQPIGESPTSPEVAATFEKAGNLGHISKCFQRRTSAASNASDISDDCFSAETDAGAMVEIYTGPELCYEATGLTPATEYAFCVQAVNAAGESRLSNALFCRTPADVPDAPSIMKLEPLSLTEILVSWTAPGDNGSSIVSYHLEILPAEQSGSGLTFPMALPPHIKQFTVENLCPAMMYRFRVQAVNDIGAGEFSTPAEASTLPPPPLPPTVELVSATHNSLKLKWQCDSSLDDDEMKYTLEMENKTGTFSPLATEMTARSYKVVRLNESTSYRFRVRASSIAGGVGPWSEIFVFTTLKAPPAAVKYAPKISDITETSCAIEWQPVKLISSVTTNDKVCYDLQIRNVCSSSNTNEGVFETVYKGPSTNYRLVGLAPGAAYKLRVSSVRISETGGETESAPSPISTFSTVPPPSASTMEDEKRESAFGRKVLTEGLSLLCGTDRQMSDRQWALLILIGFSVLALLVAFVLQRFIPEGSVADGPL